MAEHKVFLGGACGTTTWRQEQAMPLLDTYQISYYNPQQEDWTPNMIEEERRAKEDAEVLLFIIGNDTRGLASLVEIAENVGRGREVHATISTIPDPYVVADDLITGSQLDDINRAREYTKELLGHADNGHIHTGIVPALHAIVKHFYPPEETKEEGCDDCTDNDCSCSQ